MKTWLLEQVATMSNPASAGRSNTLEVKLMAAGYKSDEDEIETAKDQRRKYRNEIFQPKFLDLSDRTAIESEVQARLCRLKAQLDAEDLADTLETKKKRLLYGLMYDIMNRC